MSLDVLPFDLDIPIAEAIARHTPFPITVVRELLREFHSVDLVLGGIKTAGEHHIHPRDACRGLLNYDDFDWTEVEEEP